MSSNGPGDVPAVVRRRRARQGGRKRKGGGGGQTAAAAENQRQVATHKTRAPHKTKASDYQAPTPVVPAEVHDTKGDADRGRADSFQRTPQGRKAVRDTYDEQSPAQRRAIVDGTRGDQNDVSQEVQRHHDERVRVEGYRAAAEKFVHDGKLTSPDHAEAVRKGLDVLRTQGERAQARLAEAQYTEPKYGAGEAEDGEKHHNIFEGIGQVVKQAAGLGGGSSKARGAVAANEQFLGNIRRVEHATGPVDAAYLQTLKPALDSTSRALAETNRLASASAGGAIAASEGKNVVHGAVEGFKSNDKSYTTLAKKLGLHGAAAVIVGLAGDIAFDPSTYVSFGLSTPASALEKAAAAKAARKLAPAIKRAAKDGDEELQAKLAQQYEDQVAAARRKAGGREQTVRGVQAGVRLPGGRQVRTTGRATAAVGKQATRATGAVQASKAGEAVNEVLRAFAPHVREPGVRPLEQAGRVAGSREANALRNKVARDGRQLGKFIQRATGGDVAKVRQIVDAIEAGAVAELKGPLRAAAERASAFHERVVEAFRAEGVKPPTLAETVFAKGDVEEATSLAARAGHEVPEGAPHETIAHLTNVVEGLRHDARVNIARTRTNDELGAIRRGEADAPEVRKALQAEDFYKRKASDLRKAGNRTGARSAEAKAREARAIVKAHRVEVEPRHYDAAAEEAAPLKGAAGHLERLVDHLAERAQFEPPVGYAPRQTQAAMAAAAEGKPLRDTVYPQGAAGHEQARLERRRAEDVRQDKPDYLSDELPQLEARYGIQMGRRLGGIALWRRMYEQFARPVTGEFPIEGDQVLYRVSNHGLERINPDDTRAVQDALGEAALRHALGEGEDAGIYALPNHVDKALQERVAAAGDKTKVGAAYDKWLRSFKAANTILRPGFFATTVAGNTWQQFLADASLADMKDAWQHFAHLRGQTLYATNPKAANRKAILDWAAGSKTYVVDGHAVTFADLYEEAIDAGAIRTGSRIGDPTELTLEQQAHRRIGKGVKAKAGATNEWLGEVAEDLDDMTKAMIYVQGRTKLGLTPRQATERAFTKMIDYSDLSKAERTVFKRVMPFYVYTARNLPIQVKSLLARPGKLANYEKVRQALASLAGLPDDWETQRTEPEQERMPVALPGVRSHGFQVFLDPRLPVADIAAPAQLTEGPGGGVRMLERYASGIAPPAKVPLELLLFKRRLDYDRPIDVPGSPPVAGALLKAIPGATEDGQYVQPATGQKYTGAKPALDYLLRTFGGSPGSVVASVGADVPDRSNLDPKARAAASFGGGFGVSASDPLYAVLDAVRTATEKRYATRSELKGQGKRNSAEDIRNEDVIDALNDLKGKVQATIGFPEQKKRIFQFERNRLERTAQEPAEIRAERRRLNDLRQQYGG